MIPKKIREVVTQTHPLRKIFPGYVKGAVIEGAYAGADCFFFPSQEETEGIVVLEASASKHKCSASTYSGLSSMAGKWRNCYKGSSVDEFVDLLDKILKHEVKDLRENGQLTAQRRSIEDIGIQLKRVYERVLKM